MIDDVHNVWGLCHYILIVSQFDKVIIMILQLRVLREEIWASLSHV